MQTEYWLNAYVTSCGMQGTDLHPTLKGAIDELIEFGSDDYLETVHRTEDTVERISLLALALDIATLERKRMAPRQRLVLRKTAANGRRKVSVGFSNR